MKKTVSLILLLFFQLSIAAEIQVTVTPEKQHTIDHRIFSQFLERPSWGGEFGIEDAVEAETGQLDPRVIEKLKGMEIPVLRFPGGTDVDYMDWTEMIDLPERPIRPASVGNGGDTVTNLFGMDAFYELTRTLDCEAIIPVNFFDAYLKRKPLREAVLHAAGLAAYCNGDVGQNLPEGMPNWPEIRKQNGYEKPFKFRYFQIGNETWALWNWKKEILEKANYADPYGWYVECAALFIDVIKAIDPDIEIIADWVNEDLFNQMHPQLGPSIDYYVFHRYMPWGIRDKDIKKGESLVPVSELTEADVWRTFVSIPNEFDDQGRVEIRHPLIDKAREHDFDVAVTEWNWNGWWQVENPPLSSKFAEGVGAAGFLHGFIREADVIKMANQSMLVGSTWGITGIRVDKTGEAPPYYHPTGQMTSFYGTHHEDYLFKTTTENMPIFSQPLQLRSIKPKEKVTAVDIVFTGSEDALSIFLINREFDAAHTLNIDLSAFPKIKGKGKHIILTGELHDENAGPDKKYMWETVKNVKVKDQQVRLTVPERSVSVFKIGLKK